MGESKVIEVGSVLTFCESNVLFKLLIGLTGYINV